MHADPLAAPDALARWEAEGLRRRTTLWDEASKHPADATAVICPRQGKVTYGELRSEAEGLAAAWHADGLQPGEVVILQLPNWYDTVLAHMALTRLGAVTLTLMPTYREHELRFIAERSGAVGIVCAPSFRSDDPPPYDTLRDEIDQLRWVSYADDPRALRDLAAQGDPATLPPTPSPDDITLLLATSGTSGEPKLVMHSHRSTVGGVLQAIGSEMTLTPDDVMLMPSPIVHATGLQYGVRIAAAVGATLLLQDRWSPAAASDLVAEHGATWFMGATPFLFDLLQLPDDQIAKLETLRLFVCGGATIPESLAREAAERLPGISFMAAWGMSETGIATLVRPTDPPEKWFTSDGRPVSGWEIRIVDPESGRDVAPGEEGEIVCRGASMFHGYYGRPDLTEQSAGDGWMRSGDLATMDEEGYVRCRGRIKDLIIRGGLNISAVEVEDGVRQHPAVKDVAVIGLPDDRLGERICAVVVPQGDPPDVPALSEFLLGLGFSKLKLPEHVVAVSELPTTASGKVQKFKLRDQLAAA